jgi:hypothetical protein
MENRLRPKYLTSIHSTFGETGTFCTDDSATTRTNILR